MSNEQAEKALDLTSEATERLYLENNHLRARAEALEGIAQGFRVRIKELKDEAFCLQGDKRQLRTAIENALVSLVIISMPIVGDPKAVASNNDLLNIMADSFKEALAQAGIKR